MLIKGKVTSKPYTENRDYFGTLQSTIDILESYHSIEKHRKELENLERERILKWKELLERKNKEERKMEYKVGDKVLLKNKRGKFWNSEGKMDKYKGKVVTISKIEYDSFNIEGGTYDGPFKIGEIRWAFMFEDIERKVSSEKHFKTLPNDFTGTIEVNNGLIEEKEILNEKEKEYISAVIRPFRDKVEHISISGTINNKLYMKIFVANYDSVTLPNFEKGTMYKGMEIGKKYTLEELGL